MAKNIYRLMYQLREINREINRRDRIQSDADLQKKKREIVQAIALHTIRLYSDMDDEALRYHAQAQEKVKRL